MNVADLKKKKDFIESLNYSFTNFVHRTSIHQIKYYVFEDETEFLVLYLIGGAVIARNCTGNSQSAIFQELARLLNGGYYDEVLLFEEYLDNYKLIEFNEGV